MSYLSFLRIQCSMGNEENIIVKYVMFGKREQLTQFPGTNPVVILTGENTKTEFRPVYLFWDKTDETMVHILPFARDVLDAPGTEGMSAKLTVLGMGAAAFVLLTLTAERRAVMHFERLDL